VNEDSKRPRLFIYAPEEALRRLKDGEHVPRQLTSWSAVYHILQRYGAWVALEKFSDVFEGGKFVKRPP
jgi:hypothetical protein